ncbi:uncharacterized protein LOC110464600 isoform X2 [Mizuhopecten yessoensis]|nr:uncharacterized protein LOC110464600 isoform X2 [Mizuhopecten yessoensis]
MLDLLLRTTGIDVEDYCQRTTLLDLARQYYYTDVEEYLLWRRSHTQGLPENIRRMTNDGVMKFLKQQLLSPPQPQKTSTRTKTVPAEKFEDLPSAKINSYLEMFIGQKEKYRHIRVMFVGKEGVGKTTLCLRLQGKPVDIAIREPTEGASLYLQVFEIDLDTYTWSRIDDASSDGIMADRMGRLMRDAKKRRSLALPSELKLSLVPLNESEIEETPGDANVPMSAGIPGREPALGGILFTGASKPHMTSLPDVRKLEERQLRFVDVVRQTSELQKGDNVAFLSMWDMGGQTSFQANHGVFMSSHCVFILAFDTLEYLTERDESGRITEWIRTIGTYRSSYDKSQPSHKPPIIIVGTKMDLVNKHIPAKNNRKKQLEAIKEELCQTKEVEASVDSDGSADFVRFCTVDNTNENASSYDDIRNLILEAAKHQDQWERELPVNWLVLERDLLKQRTLGRKILTLDEIYEIDAKCEFPIKNKEDIMLFLEYLHRNRTIVFFRGHNQAVIDPQWLADAFRRLITDKLFIERDLTLRRHLVNFQSFAKLTLSLIEELLASDESKGFREHMPILLVFMEKFGLLVRPIDGFDCRGKVIFANHYFVPSKLKDPSNTAQIDEELRNARFVTKTLCIMFNEVFIPRDLFDRILAGCLQKYALTRNSTGSAESSTLLQGFGCFQIEGVWNLIVSLQWNRSAITLTLYSMTERSIYLNTGRRLLKEIKIIIDTVLKTNCHEHMTYRDHLHCSYRLGPRDDPLPVDEVIMTRSHHLCRGETCRQKHQLGRRHLSVWITDTRHAQPRENYIPGQGTVPSIPPAGTRQKAWNRIRNWRKFFRNLLRTRSKKYVPTEHSEDPDHFGIPHRMPTAREFGRLSEHVGSWYTLMFAELGMESHAIEQIQSECSQLSFRSQITKMFLRWSTQFREQTYAHIASAVSKFGVDQDHILKTIERRSDIHRTVKGVELQEKTLNRKPTDDEIRIISENVNKSYFNLCLELGLKVPEIDQVDVEYDKVKDKMAKLLKRWVRGCKEPPATIRRILLAMERCNMDVATIGKMGLS